MASWNDLPIEISMMVLQSTTDISSFMNLLLADSSLEAVFRSTSKAIFRSLLRNTVPLELQKLIYVLFVLHDSEQVEMDDVKLILHSNLDECKHGVLSKMKVKDPMSALQHIADIQAAADYFTGTFIRCVCQPPPDVQRQQTFSNSKVSVKERYRIQRALWRFQFYFNNRTTFHYTGALLDFLQPYNYWETEELRCVYRHIVEMLYRDSRDPHINSLGMPYHPFDSQYWITPLFSSIPGVQSWSRHVQLYRGLPYLHTRLKESPISERPYPTPHLGIQEPSSRVQYQDYKVIYYHITAPSVPLVISSAACPWADNYGANVANLGHRYAIDTNDDSRTFRGMKHLDLLVAFGYCIWDEERLRDWGILTQDFVRRLGSSYLNRISDMADRWKRNTPAKDASKLLFAKYCTQQESLL